MAFDDLPSADSSADYGADFSADYLSASKARLVLALDMLPLRRKRLFRLDSLTLIRCPPLVRLNMTFPRAVILTRLASPLCDFCLGTFCLPSEPEFRAP